MALGWTLLVSLYWVNAWLSVAAWQEGCSRLAVGLMTVWTAACVATIIFFGIFSPLMFVIDLPFWLETFGIIKRF
jgi:hypothetical protein